jgi:two-component system, OmpR family, alkaline phosphatase synthesis response regulator PhoP
MALKKILVIEDQEDIRELIHFNLFKNGYEVFLACDGKEALSKVKSESPELILLDLMLPKIDGLKVCQNLKNNEKTRNIPIIMLTAKGEENDIVKGLEAGADDYITKPFLPKVLLARIKAVGRRYSSISAEKNKFLKIRNIVIDPVKRIVKIDNKNIDMTYSEFQILHLLASKPGWVFTRSQIVNSVRGENHAITDRAVDVQIVGLRKKLDAEGKYIETVRSIGYRFKENEE